MITKSNNHQAGVMGPPWIEAFLIQWHILQIY